MGRRLRVFRRVGGQGDSPDFSRAGGGCSRGDGGEGDRSRKDWGAWSGEPRRSGSVAVRVAWGSLRQRTRRGVMGGPVPRGVLPMDPGWGHPWRRLGPGRSAVGARR
eukprot:2969127-Heterocapsa_arctica.AAC.1